MNGELKNSVLRVTVSISCKDFQHQIQNEKLTKKQVFKIEKAKTYEQLILQIEFLIKDIDNHVGALSNVSTLLHSSFLHYFWCGFYVVKEDVRNLAFSR